MCARVLAVDTGGTFTDLLVSVNAISPGPVETPMLNAELAWFGNAKTVRDTAINHVPLKRFATPFEVAVMFLPFEAGDATGSTLRLDGGTTSV